MPALTGRLAAIAAGGALLASCHGDTSRLTFWNGFTGPDGRTMSAMVRDFNAEHPGTPVEMQRLQWNTYYNKLLITLRHHRAPDVFVIHVNQIPRFAQGGRLAVLDDLASAEPGLADDFLPGPWQSVHHSGHLVAIPLDVHPMGMYWNPTLFREAGIVDANGDPAPPRTREEFLAAAHALTRDADGDGHPDQWGFVLTWPRTNFISLAAQFGGGLWDEEANQPTLDRPENIEALRFLVSLWETEGVMPRPGTVDSWAAFRQGRVGMAFEGAYMLTDLRRSEGLDYAGAPLPRLGLRDAAWTSSHCLAMRGDIAGERRREAWRFICWLSSHSLAWAAGGGMVPTRRSLLGSDAFAAMPVQRAFAQQMDHLVYEPLVPEVSALQIEIDRALSNVLDTGADPAEALAAAQRHLLGELAR